MALPFPFILPAGSVAIYGEYEVGVSGVRPGDRKFVFGYVYQISSDVYSVYNGDCVLYNKNDVNVRLVWANTPYQQIEAAKLAGVDEVIP